MRLRLPATARPFGPICKLVTGQVRDLLRASEVVHADETGLRVEAALAWVHAVSSTELTLYHLDEKRCTEAMDAMGVIEHLSGFLVHDGWAPYRKYDNVTHALCGAHHLRELEAAESTDGQSWAADMAGLLTDTWHLVFEAKAAGQHALSDGVLAEVRENYMTIIVAGHVANPPVAPSGKCGRTKRTKAHNLLLRFDAYADDVLRFASAEAFLAFRSELSTAAKQGINRLDALQRLSPEIHGCQLPRAPVLDSSDSTGPLREQGDLTSSDRDYV